MKRIALALVASVGVLTTATAANTYNVVADWLKLPAGREQLGNQHGDIAVLKREGLPPLRGKGRGDLHVVFELVVPEELSAEDLELVRRLDASLSGEEPAPARKRK